MAQEDSQDEYVIGHPGSTQGLRAGMTVGGRTMYITWQTRQGETEGEYLTKTELGEFIEFLIDKHTIMQDSP